MAKYVSTMRKTHRHIQGTKTMVEDHRLNAIYDKFKVRPRNLRTNGSNQFVDISVGSSRSTMTIQHVNDNICNIYFENSQFFEVPDELLYKIVNAILSGSYHIEKRGIFRKRTFAVIKVDNEDIYPDIIEK